MLFFEVLDNARLLLRVLWQPGAAMSAILDRGSLLFACAAALVVGFFVQPVDAVLGLSFRFYTPLLLLAAVYVPGVLIVGRLLWAWAGSLGAVFQRDYSPMLTCAAMAWAAAGIPLALAIRVLSPAVWPLLALLACVYFGFLMLFAVRTVAGTGNARAAGVAALSWIPLAAAFFFYGPLYFLFRWIASPFFLLLAFFYLRNEIGNLGAGLRARQNYRRMLDTAAVNPHDADAQYQLGLIYQQRRQYSEAIRRFQNAVAIDPREADAHFQLGRIAREQGRLHDALEHFQTTLDLDERHSQSEILRELGAVYVAARQYGDAANELGPYVERRPYDPEGLYCYGRALEGLGKAAEARDMYRRAIESARTAPPFRRAVTARWSRLAEKQLRKLE